MLDRDHIPPESVRPLGRREYDHLVDAGLFEGERVELLYGTVVRMSPHGPDHDAPLDRLTRILVVALGDRAKVRVQSAFAASDLSEPEPDLAVVPPREYDDAHPSEGWLIVEVARSSLAKDRTVKARVYAESRVAEYWIVNVEDDVIERYTSPVDSEFQAITVHPRGESLRLVHFPDVEIPVAAIVRRRAT